MLTALKNLVSDENGVSTVEYGLMVALVSLVAVAAIGFCGRSLTDIFSGAMAPPSMHT